MVSFCRRKAQPDRRLDVSNSIAIGIAQPLNVSNSINSLCLAHGTRERVEEREECLGALERTPPAECRRDNSKSSLSSFSPGFISIISLYKQNQDFPIRQLDSDPTKHQKLSRQQTETASSKESWETKPKGRLFLSDFSQSSQWPRTTKMSLQRDYTSLV